MEPFTQTARPHIKRLRAAALKVRSLVTVVCASMMISHPVLGDENKDDLTQLDLTSLMDMDVVVTAQRRKQDLKSVPIAATVLTGQMLERKGVQNIIGLQYAAPSLTVSDYGSANVVNIRGIGRSAVDIELSSGVVIYRDGVPTFPGYFQNEPYFDLDAIEVLRGPQGTFVGKSAAGGGIFVRTAAPDLSGFKARVEGEVGNYRQFGGTAVVNAPLNDEFGVRMAYRHLQRDDVLVDSLSGPFTGRPGRPKLDSLRLGALWKPSKDFTTQLRVDLSDLDFGGNLTSNYGSSLVDLVQNADFMYRDRSTRAVGDVKYTFDDGLLLSAVTGYQHLNTVNNFDFNGNQSRVNRLNTNARFDLYSQEINVISPDTGRFTYVLGAFAQRTDSVIPDWRNAGFTQICDVGDLGFVLGSVFPCFGLETPYTKREDEWSAFVHMTYDISERWEAALGLRYSRYEIENDLNIVFGDGLGPLTIPFFAGTPSLRENDVDGKLSLTWEVTKDHSIFALLARGHVTAGFNIFGGAKFDKEIVYDYEAGWKGVWADGRVRSQVSVFYQTFSDYQAQFASEALPNVENLKNAGSPSTSYGLEANIQALFGRASIDAGVALLESELGTYPRVVNPSLPPPNNIVSISGGETPFAPKVAFNIGASYKLASSKGLTIVPRLDLSYLSEQNAVLIAAPNTRLPARTLLNGGIRVEKGAWYGDLFGTNLLDKRYVGGIQDLGNVWYPAPPRQYGVRIGVNF